MDYLQLERSLNSKKYYSSVWYLNHSFPTDGIASVPLGSRRPSGVHSTLLLIAIDYDDEIGEDHEPDDRIRLGVSPIVVALAHYCKALVRC